MRIWRGNITQFAIRLRKWSIFRSVPVLILIPIICAVIIILGFLQNTFAAPPCPCNVFTVSQPASPPPVYVQAGGIEVGFKFRSNTAGYISGIRFYKGPGMSGVHTASLWDSSGNRIAQAPFVSESAAGWQQVDISPVAVAANTIYTASVYMANGNYTATSNFFASAVNNSPLTAPANSFAQDAAGRAGQGVYNASGSSLYPTDSYNAGNYWVDVAYIGSASAADPTITAHTPVADASNIPVGDVTISAAFDGALDPNTVTNNVIEVKNSQGAIVSGTVIYEPTTRSLSFTADSAWKTSETYDVTVRGGSDPLAVKDMQGYTLSVDKNWSFTTSSIALDCPCDFKQGVNPAGSTTNTTTSTNGLELGLKIVPKVGGYITALRFYKPITSTDTTHSGHIWDKTGNVLATVTFTNESDYGWQEAQLVTPLPVVKDQVYVISYGISQGQSYQSIEQGTAQDQSSDGMTAYSQGDARNQATGSGTANGIFATAKGDYPTQPSAGKPDYYVDAIFATQVADTTPLVQTSETPTDGSYAVDRQAPITASFDHPLDSSTVTPTTVRMFNDQNTQISGTVSYDANKRSVRFSPLSSLQVNTTYTIRLSNQIKDLRGAPLTNGRVWSFTTGSSLTTSMNQGNGGPLLVVTDSATPSNAYYAEILKTEGFTYFDVKDKSQLSSLTLSQYKSLVLGTMPLTQTQVDTVSSWVENGGSLIAMRPDKKLANLLGLNDVGSVGTNQYLKTSTSSVAGMGIVDETIQYKGIADNYTRSSAEAVATLYSTGTVATAYPAATTRAVGSGTAMAFTYDLAQSVIGLHQGNKAWSAQDRDNDSVIRTNDLFYGARAGDSQPDWLDSTKMHIPQADEQQRLFANMITEGMRKSMPAPRFWYLPDMKKAALVLAGDDHYLNAVDDRSNRALNHQLNESTIGCSVSDWQCIRASHYVYATSPLTLAQAVRYESYGFEIGNHPSNMNSCTTFSSYAQLSAHYSNETTNWQAKYISLPQPKTSRFHCYVWSDWDMMPRAEVANGVRYDLNSVAYPASWIGTNGTLVTGSGMNMRLADINGAMLDVRQGVTNFENGSTPTASVMSTIDNALGASGYYGIFGTHYDMTDSYEQSLVSIAKSRNIPVITSLQALEWLDSRNCSNFSDLTGGAVGKVSFEISACEGAHGLRAMMPLKDKNGTLTALAHDDHPISYDMQTIKGVEYALFEARPGAYEVIYSDYVAPVDEVTPPATVPEMPVVQSGIKSGAGIVVGVNHTTQKNINSKKTQEYSNTEGESDDTTIAPISSSDTNENTNRQSPDSQADSLIKDRETQTKGRNWATLLMIIGVTAVPIVGVAGWVLFRSKRGIS